jgi:hypothetical protein
MKHLLRFLPRHLPRFLLPQEEPQLILLTVICLFLLGTGIGFMAPACTHATPTVSTVTQSLIEAGCLANTPDAVQAVAAERGRPTSLGMAIDCLFDGGTISNCQVPCSK